MKMLKMAGLSSGLLLATSMCLGQVFVSFDGKPVIKNKDYEPALKMLKEREPGLAKIWDQMPAQQKRMIVKQVIDQKKTIEIAKKFIATKGLNKTEKYQKQRAELLDIIEGDLAMKALQEIIGKDLKVDAKAFYTSRRSTDGAFQNKSFLITPATAGEPVFKEFNALPKEVQEEIKQYAEGVMLQEALAKKFEELEKEYKVVVHGDAIEKLFPG